MPIPRHEVEEDQGQELRSKGNEKRLERERHETGQPKMGLGKGQDSNKARRSARMEPAHSRPGRRSSVGNKCRAKLESWPDHHDEKPGE